VALKTTQIGHNRVTARSIKFRKKLGKSMKSTLGIPNYFDRSQASWPTVPAIQKLLEEIGAEATLISPIKYSM
jgi:hypothetical protein